MASGFRKLLPLSFAFAVLASATPALASDDDGASGTINTLLGFIGAAPEKDTTPLDYRERAPLVIPPSRGGALPQPQAPGAKRNAAWPNDPDVAARRAAAADARRPANHVNERASSGMVPVEELKRGRIDQGPQDTRSDCKPGSNTPGCLYAPWSELAAKKAGDEGSDTVVAGKEPTRKYLTDPPAGYRTATQTTKATMSGKAAKPEDDGADAGAYIRSQRNKRFGDGED